MQMLQATDMGEKHLDPTYHHWVVSVDATKSKRITQLSPV